MDRRSLIKTLPFLVATPYMLQAPEIKKVTLIGDSIRMGYAPTVISELGEKVTVLSPKENGEHTINVLKYLHLWVQRANPDVVHINAGLHDIRTLVYDTKTTDRLVPLAQYRENVGRILSFVKTYSKATPIWATITPINEANAHAIHKQWQDFDRYEADVLAYNDAAKAVCKKAGVEVNDLYQFGIREKITAHLDPDGVHFTAEGSEKLGKEVARVIKGYLK